MTKEKLAERLKHMVQDVVNNMLNETQDTQDLLLRMGNPRGGKISRFKPNL